MIDDRQIRAARALLGWTQEILAEASGIARATIKNLETSSTTPRLDTLLTIQRALEEAGVEFIPGSGVRLREKEITSFEGRDATRKWMEAVRDKISPCKGEVCIYGMDDEKLVRDVGMDFIKPYVQHMDGAGTTSRILFKYGDTNFAVQHRFARWIDARYFPDGPIVIFGDCVALSRFGAAGRCVIVQDLVYAETLRRMFMFVWDRAELPVFPAA